MLLRVVRMTFNPQKVSNFKSLFDEVKPKIQNFPGCRHVELCSDATNPYVFYTFSKWEDERSLEAYRTSDLFQHTWTRTKVLFDDKPLAFSLLSDD